MVQTAKVISKNGSLAVVEVSRKAMCDGCHNSKCEGGCAMSGLVSGGSKMTATAINEAKANIGDTVEIETSDKEVLSLALIVFIMPIIVGGIFFAVATHFGLAADISTILAIVGFAAAFPFMKIAEKRQSAKGPRLVVKRIVTDDSADGQNEEI